MQNKNNSEIRSTREAILQASYKHFRDQGYHGTSMRQISESAGIALGGIYNHFDSKEQIFSTVLLDFHPIHEVIPAVMRGASGDVTNFVRHAALTIMTTLNNRPDFLNLMFIELVEFRNQHIPLLYEQLFPRGLEMVQAFATKQHGIRPIPIDVILRAFLGLMFSLVICKALLGPQGGEIGGAGEISHYVDIFLHGILEEEAA
jgi:AcrR family transcriptional regulator